MKIQTTKILGVLLINLRVFKDSRGGFLESYQQSRYKELGLDVEFVQDNHSHSVKNVLRGLHYQIKRPQGHLIYVMRGDIFDVGVDLRPESPTFGQWLGFRLSGDQPQQVFMPAGIAHGFCVLSDRADILYKCTDYFVPDDEGGLLWNDPDLKIEWPIHEPLVNERDSGFPALKQISKDQLPVL
ncbi:MAG TPA: dTDP-4-dehydrorhamnose 3,5-epimerase [Candidatus Marinimicrobia bacterium]|jgi:dTDP-4-dehydrorhamnose 3,5-epimerase|nr:dTDP-4-dehydrorhamnose 3,5-epimerase [Candidatus Neomarinimicrobiota bacterium]|tara:strand:- start:505 stop:1056 length:552 start_codon:yes stop_codon:yes gene_type:complete